MKSIRTKILAGFSLVILLVVILAISSFIFVTNNNHQVEETLTEDLTLIIADQKLSGNMQERIALVRGYLLMGDREFLERFEETTEESIAYQEQILNLSQSEQAKELVQKSVEWRKKITEKVIPAYDRGDKELALEIMKNEVVPLGREVGDGFDELTANMEKEMIEDRNYLIGSGENLELLILVISTLSIILGIVIAIVISRMISNPIIQVKNRLQLVAEGNLLGDKLVNRSKDEIGQLVGSLNTMTESLKDLIGKVHDTSAQVAATSEELTASAEQTSKATEQITIAIQEVSAGSQQQVSSVTETTNIVIDISKGMEQVASSIRLVADLSSITTQKAEVGNQVVTQTIQQMNSVQQQVQDTALVVNLLGEKSKEIGQIVELITQIAGQTNLLALNAAIEAARAGEHGRGFAVVADEVRKLAEQSGQAAGEIRELIGQIQNESLKAVSSMKVGTESVNEGIQMVYQTGDSFRDILNMIEEVSSQSQEVAAIVEQVNAGSIGMVEAMEQVVHISEQSAGNSQSVAASAEEQLASMEEISSSANSLSRMAEELNLLVGRFKI